MEAVLLLITCIVMSVLLASEGAMLGSGVFGGFAILTAMLVGAMVRGRHTPGGWW